MLGQLAAAAIDLEWKLSSVMLNARCGSITSYIELPLSTMLLVGLRISSSSSRHVRREAENERGRQLGLHPHSHCPRIDRCGRAAL